MNDPGLGPATNMADSNHASGSNKFTPLLTPPSQSPVVVGSAAPPKRIINRIPLDFNKLKQAGLDIKLAEALRKQSSTAMPAATSLPAPAAAAATTTAQSAAMTSATATASIEQKPKSAPPSRRNRSTISKYIEKLIPEEIVAERSQHLKTLIKNRILNKGRITSTLNTPKSSPATLTTTASPSSSTSPPSLFMSPIAKADVTVRSKQPPLLLNLVNQLPKNRALCGPSMQQLCRQQQQEQPVPQPQPVPVVPLIHKAPSPPLIVLENKVLAPEEKIDLSDLRLPNSSTMPQTSRSQGKPVPVMARQVQTYPGPNSSKTKVILNANKLKVSREKLAEMAKQIHSQVKQVEKKPAPATVSPLKITEDISPVRVSFSPSPSTSPLSSPSPAPKVLSAVDFIAQLTADNPLDESSFIELSPEEQMMSALFGSRGGSMQPTVEEPPKDIEPEEELPIGKILKLDDMDILHATLDVNEDRESVLRFSPNALKLQSSVVTRRDQPEANMRIILTEEHQLQELLEEKSAPAEGTEETAREMSKDVPGMTEGKASEISENQPIMIEGTAREMSKNVPENTEGNVSEMSKNPASITEETVREKCNDEALMSDKTVKEMSKDEEERAQKAVKEIWEEATDPQKSETEAKSVPNPASNAAPSKEKDKPQPAPRPTRFKKGKVNLVQRSKRANPPKTKAVSPEKELNDAKRARLEVEQPEEEEPTMDQSFLEDSYGRRREVEVQADAGDVGECAVEAGKEAEVREKNNEEPEEILVSRCAGSEVLKPQEDTPPKPSTERDLNQLYHPPKMPKNKSNKSNNSREDQSDVATTSSSSSSSSSSNVSLLLDVLQQEPPAEQGEALLPFRKQSQTETKSPSQDPVPTGINNLMSHLSAEKIVPQSKRVSPTPNQAAPRKKLVKTRPVLNKRSPRIGSIAAGQPISVSGAGSRIPTSSTSDDDASVFLGFDNKEEEQPVKEEASLKRGKQIRCNETDISDDATPDYDETEEENQQENPKKSNNENQTLLGGEKNDLRGAEAEHADSESNASPMQMETLYSMEVEEISEQVAEKCEAIAEISTELDTDPQLDSKTEEELSTATAVPPSNSINVSESPEIAAVEPESVTESKDSARHEDKPSEKDSNECETSQIETDLKETSSIEEPPEQPTVEAKGQRRPRGRPKRANSKAHKRREEEPREEENTSDVPDEAQPSPCGKRKRATRSTSTESVPVLPEATPAEDEDQPESTPSMSPNRKRQARLSSPTTTAKVPAKRGRKSLAAVTEATPTTTPTPETLNKLQLEEETIEVTPTRKRGRPRQTAESTPKPNDEFQLRLLLIRKREQLDTNEDLYEQGKGPLQCGVCLGRTTKANWNKHLKQHYGVGWVLAEQEPQQTLSRVAVLNMMKGYLKDGHATHLSCRLCDRQLGSGLGMLTHLESCGDNDKPECQYCKRTYTKLYHPVHEKSCGQRPMAQQQQEKADKPEAETPYSNVDWIKRLLLIRKREELATNEELTEKGTGKGPLQCGLCLARSTKDMWTAHLRQHYGVGWLTGKEPQPLSRKTLLAMMIAYLKQGHAKHLECRLCGRQLGSGLGMLMHLESCGDNDRVECQHCKRTYTKLYHAAHEKSCKERPGLQQKKEDAAEAVNVGETTGPMYTNAGHAKRKSTIKAENKLKKIKADLKTQDNEERDSNTKSKDDFEGDSSDYDMNQDKESSEEYDSEAVDSNEDAAQTEDDISPSDMPRLKQINRVKRKNVEGKSMKNDRQTGGTNCQPLFSRYAKLHKKVEQKWNQFTDKNYAAEALYPQLKPAYCRLSSAEARELLPAKDTRSMRYAYGDVENADDWRQLAPLESFQTVDEHIGFLGAPIKQLAWAPLPPTVTEQYLLCSLRKHMLAHARQIPHKFSDALLMLLKCKLSASVKERQGVWPLETSLHYAIRVPNGPVHTFAFMPSGGYDKSANRLGLLAVANSLTDVKIYALPLELEDEATGNVVIELQSTLTLTLDVQNPVMDQCTKICWSEGSSHNLLVTGYASGNVAFWEISDEQSINCFKQKNHSTFVPLHFFYFGEHNIQILELHYDTSGPRWLAIGTSTRKLWIYDIINWSQPMPLNEDSISNLYLASAFWPPIWEALVVACSDVQRRFYSRLISLSPTGILFNNKTVDYTISSGRAMHFNVQENIQVVATDNGDLVFLNVRELNAEPILLKMLSKFRVVSTSNLCNMSTELTTPATPDTPITTDDFLRDFGLNLKPLSLVTNVQKAAYINPKRLPKEYELLPMTRLNTVRCNWNRPAHSWVAVGAEHGMLRIVNFDQEKFF
ncbi:uncharacterized protein LOC117579300 isoform X2 [Drosophila guanche]|uniref:Blast:Muscle M-line assembly protein unc-89 n=2 Tax=Drosophila guanche TaxID=7266 RepID=A0A3B0JB92_DROGU|nr:uncharacterized protein LOC117579300 isoform X2 [Drosophila guanche]SPP77292.1 blast:Muscle M-line assembly protein unc-89 [Drosophila guanche]